MTSIAQQAIAEIEAVAAEGGQDLTATAEILRNSGSALSRYQADQFDSKIIPVDVFAKVAVRRAQKDLTEAWAKISGQKKGQKMTAEKIAVMKAMPDFQEFKQASGMLEAVLQKYCPEED